MRPPPACLRRAGGRNGPRVGLMFDPEQWPSVPPHGEQEIPNAELMGYDPDARQAGVYWWTNGEYGTSVVVDLR